jgi:hypothetical protein
MTFYLTFKTPNFAAMIADVVVHLLYFCETSDIQLISTILDPK